MTMPVTNERATRCPRCGYDLRGAIETWQEACPLRGTCTECGLSIHWAEVLVPEKFEPPWCVEYVKPLRRFGWAWAQTVARSGRPFRFWSTLKMSMPTRRARLMAYVILLLLPILFAGISIQTVVAIRVRNLVQQQMQAQRAQALGRVSMLQGMLKGDNLPAEHRLAVQQALAATTLAPSWSINHSYGAAVAEAVLLPWRSSSWGTITSSGIATGYVAPRDLYATLSSQTVRRRSAWRMEHAVLTLSCFGVGMWIAISMPLAFVLLPISRRRAKVRWGHLARVACYGLVIPAAIITCMLGCVAVGYAFAGWQTRLDRVAHAVGRFGMVLGVIVWWAAAIRCYLHIPHGWAIAPIFAILVFVILAGALFFIGGFLFMT